MNRSEAHMINKASARGALIAVTLLTLVAGVSSTRAQSGTLNFDTLPDGASGDVLSNYFASYGIAVSGVTPGVSVYVRSGSDLNNQIQASSGQQFLYWSGFDANVAMNFTLNFSQPLTNFSFTRCAEFSVASFPEWSATVYQGETVIGTAGEGLYSLFSGETPANTYSFTGSGITSVAFSSNDEGFSGYSSPGIDDIVVAPVPEPATWMMVLVGIGALLGGRRMRRHSS